MKSDLCVDYPDEHITPTGRRQEELPAFVVDREEDRLGVLGVEVGHSGVIEFEGQDSWRGDAESPYLEADLEREKAKCFRHV